MTNSTNRSQDVRAALKAILAVSQGLDAVLARDVLRYLVATGRQIWPLLPHHDSRRAIEVAEQYANGLATLDDLCEAEYAAEHAAFGIDYDFDKATVSKWIDEVRRIPRDELNAMLPGAEPGRRNAPRDLLVRAAYFADYVAVYPYNAWSTPEKSAALFLSMHQLKSIVGQKLYEPVPPN
jgi:hypothetical protein